MNCEKCGTKMSKHTKFEICMECRRSKCPICGKEFVPNKNVLNGYCSGCYHNQVIPASRGMGHI